jgi:hypothetical protein
VPLPIAHRSFENEKLILFFMNKMNAKKIFNSREMEKKIHSITIVLFILNLKTILSCIKNSIRIRWERGGGKYRWISKAEGNWEIGKLKMSFTVKPWTVFKYEIANIIKIVADVEAEKISPHKNNMFDIMLSYLMNLIVVEVERNSCSESTISTKFKSSSEMN